MPGLGVSGAEHAGGTVQQHPRYRTTKANANQQWNSDGLGIFEEGLPFEKRLGKTVRPLHRGTSVKCLIVNVFVVLAATADLYRPRP